MGRPKFPEKQGSIGCDPASGEKSTFSVQDGVAEFIDKEGRVPFMQLVDELAAFFPKLEKSGFFDLPEQKVCRSIEHNPPTHLYIPEGKGYRHVCPDCGNVTTIIPQQISL